MKRLIFIGGLPYSGKSSLCERLSAHEPEKYRHVEIDALFNQVAIEGDKFFKYLRRLNPKLYDRIKAESVMSGVFDPTKQLFTFGRAMSQSGSSKKMQKLMQELTHIYAADILRNSSCPVVDALLINRESRKISYDMLNKWICDFENRENPKDPIVEAEENCLDPVDKVFVYFDLGKKLSLKRLKQGRKKQFRALEITEKYITYAYDSQELPSEKEFPNLEVVVVRNSSEIDECFERLTEDSQLQRPDAN